MTDIAKEMIYAKILARDLQEAAAKNLQRNDKLLQILFDPNEDLDKKYEAFFRLCGGPDLKKIKDKALQELNLIYTTYMILKAHSEKLRKEAKRRKNKDIPLVTFENKMRILKARFNNILLRMLKVAFPAIYKTLWGIRGIAEEEKTKEITFPFEE